MRHTFTLFLFFISLFPLFSQETEQAVVPITLTLNPAPLSVDLSWPLPTGATEQLLIRREKDAADWFILLEVLPGGTLQATFSDPLVEVGKTYEYLSLVVANGIAGFGYMTVAIEAPAVDSRGTLLVFVEAALQTPLAAELDRLGRDLVGDGWQVVWHPVEANATVATVKTQIVSDFNADPSQVKSVLLLGEIPVPYSGNTQWDGHPEHNGAWVADSYYGDVEGAWTDAVVNNTTPARPANDNVPGDGKFDHSITPTALELAVGRVDFSNLSETTFGASHTELMRRYLDKNHRWRTKQYTVENKALVDDNFGYFGGEAFAANGYRNFYPLVGTDNVVDGDFFTSTDTQSFLYAYGCGGGTYTSAGGVGSSDNFATDSINVAFSMLFGSYHGDWDYETNPFMMAALASKGGILSCSWAGRPHWFNHHLAVGETLGYCGLATQNACDNPGYFNSTGNCGAHVTLLGDPSLRTHVVAPVSSFATVNRCHSVDLAWGTSPAANLLGYLVYRADALDGDFVRLTPDPILATEMTDGAPLLGENFYQVRAVVLEQTPSGSYFNTSTGVITNTFFQTGTPPTVTATGGQITCDDPSAILSATSNAAQPTYQWTGPGNFTAQAPATEATTLGIYTVTVTDGTTGCSAAAETNVSQDANLPTANPAPNGALTCTVSSVQLLSNPGQAGLSFAWAGPNFSSAAQNPVVSTTGSYSLTVTAPNGCAATYFTQVDEDLAAPNAVIAPPASLTCSLTQLQLDGSASSSGAIFNYNWTTVDGSIASGQITPTPVITDCGTYLLTVTNIQNGCTATATAIVACDVAPPVLTIQGDTEIVCFGGTTSLLAVSSAPNSTFNWAGQPNPSSAAQTVAPGIFTVTTTAPNGCTDSETVEVTSTGTQMTVSFVASVDCDGFVLIVPTITGGEPPYLFQITPPGPISPNTIYQIVVTDANACTVSLSGETPDFNPLTAGISHTDETISGLHDGTATALPSFGSPPYSFEWSNGGTAQTITGLAPGEYIVTVTDANGCEETATAQVMPGLIAAHEIEGLRSLRLFPNPTGGQFQISLLLDAPARVSLEITDVTGRLVFSSPSVNALETAWPVDLTGQMAGVYFCKILVGEKWVLHQVVVD